MTTHVGRGARRRPGLFAAAAATLLVCGGTLIGVIDPSSASATSASINPFRVESTATTPVAATTTVATRKTRGAAR